MVSLHEIAEFVSGVLKTELELENATLSKRGLRALIKERLNAEAGKDYEKAWLNEQICQLVS